MGAKHSRQQTGLTVRTRVMVVWIWRLVPYWRPVSNNILREVLQYLPTYRMQLLRVLPSKVLTFDLDQLKWRPLFALKQTLPECPSTYALLLDSDQVLVRINVPQEARTYILTAGAVEVCANLLEFRTLDGIVSLPDTSSVYAFGGMRDETTLVSAETMPLARRQWKSLPWMNEARHSFNPCPHLECVYLCGGSVTGASERFHPVKWTYEVIALTTSPGSSAAVSLGESLLVFSSHLCQLWRGEVVEQRTHCLHSLVASSPPLFERDHLYIFNPFLMKAYELHPEGEARLL